MQGKIIVVSWSSERTGGRQGDQITQRREKAMERKRRICKSAMLQQLYICRLCIYIEAEGSPGPSDSDNDGA